MLPLPPPTTSFEAVGAQVRRPVEVKEKEWPSSVESWMGGEVAGERGEPEAATCQKVVANANSSSSVGRAPDTARQATLADFRPTKVTLHHGLFGNIPQQLSTPVHGGFFCSLNNLSILYKSL